MRVRVEEMEGGCFAGCEGGKLGLWVFWGGGEVWRGGEGVRPASKASLWASRRDWRVDVIWVDWREREARVGSCWTGRLW